MQSSPAPPQLPLALFEDEHLLVVNKPAGLNTHAPSPFAGEGLYDWLRHREPRWASLAIVHRLDKETSGVMVFSKTALANRSLTEQFTAREVKKKYLLLTDKAAPAGEFTVTSSLVRAGERYLSRPLEADGEQATTRFTLRGASAGLTLFEAEPLTGRTHQIRVHAADRGLPVLGDTLYGGAPAPRLCLHAESIAFRHPETGKELNFGARADFEADARLALRRALIESELTTAFCLAHGASDGWPGWYVDRLGDYLLSHSETPLDARQAERLRSFATAFTQHASRITAAYHRLLLQNAGQATTTATSPQLVFGQPTPARFTILENGLRYELSFNQGYSVGLFLDQRDNRRRFLVNHVAANFPLFPEGAAGCEVLNTFAYTCGFSLCAAQAGARATSVDLSKKYLAWGQRNFALNDLDPSAHDFIYGDAFEWLGRLARKPRRFDVIVLDPPTFSRSKEWGAFQAQMDYPKLLRAAVPLLKAQGVLLACTNAAGWQTEEFVANVEQTIAYAGRGIAQRHYAPQPPDFPISREEPAHLKTLWLRIN